jgi:hypothetical protein
LVDPFFVERAEALQTLRDFSRFPGCGKRPWNPGPPTAWTKLAYTRSYTLKYGMRAAKLTAVIDCIKAVRQEEPLPLP